MPRTKLLASALALALGGTSLAQAQSFTGVITFGDSLSDSGNIGQLTGRPGNTFTTNPDPVYAEIVANAFGFTGTNSLAGGSNYAYGGACARANAVGVFTCVNSPGSFSLTSQLGGYLAANGGQADPDALYMMWGGANDIFTAAGAPATAQLNTGIAAQTMIGLIGTLQNAGAETIVVFNLPDLGITPGNVGTPAQAGASGLAFVYNQTFNAGLATLGDGIVAINTFGLINEIVGNPSLYGFTNVTGRACGNPSSSVACGPVGSGNPFSYAAGREDTWLFADDVHPTGAAHAMLANVVLATLSAPGSVSMAGELPLQVYADHSGAINNQIFGMNGAARDAGESNVYGNVSFTRQEFAAAANTNALDNDQFTATFGADVRYSDMISVGAAISVGGSKAETFGADIDGRGILLSAYGVAHFGLGYASAIISGGSNSLDIDRSFALGPATRVEKGSTNATHTAVELGVGFAFGSDAFKHGPFASLAWQEVDVGGYKEDSLDSTSMYFNDFTRKSTVGRIGYQAQATSGAFQPYGRVAFAKEDSSSVTAVQAGSNTMNGTFTLDGFTPAEDWLEADVGVRYALNDSTEFNFSFRGRMNDDSQDSTSLNIGMRMEF